MPRGRPLKALEVSQGAREELQSLVRSRSLPAGLVRRAEIVLLCADGLDNQAVAERVRTSRQTVGKWRERFRIQGLMGLYDERKPGRPRSIEDDELMVVLRKTLETRPPDGSTHSSCRSMAEATGISKSTVHRLWRASSLTGRRTSSSPPIRSSPRRSTTSSDSTSTRPTARWYSAWTRRTRSRRWTTPSRCFRCVRGRWPGRPTTTRATAPPRSSSPSTSPRAKSPGDATRATGPSSCGCRLIDLRRKERVTQCHPYRTKRQSAPGGPPRRTPRRNHQDAAGENSHSARCCGKLPAASIRNAMFPTSFVASFRDEKVPGAYP